LLGAALSLAFPFIARTFHYPNPLAWLAYPNIIVYVTICPNVHLGCTDRTHDFVATAVSFLVPALLYGALLAVPRNVAGLFRRP
jgi:hypothetical protein